MFTISTLFDKKGADGGPTMEGGGEDSNTYLNDNETSSLEASIL